MMNKKNKKAMSGSKDQKVPVGLFTNQFTGGIFGDFGKIASLARECVSRLFFVVFHVLLLVCPQSEQHAARYRGE
jgi:hypothetical protein